MTKIPCHVSQEQGADFGSLLWRKNYHLINHHKIYKEIKLWHK